MKELKEHTAIVSILLIGIGALRLLLLGEYYNISLWSYISFSNIFAYTFDVLRGMIWYAPLVMLFVAFKGRLSSSWILKRCIGWYAGAAALFLGVAYYWYKYITLTPCGAFWLRYVLLFGFLLLDITLKKWNERAKPWRPVLSDFPIFRFVLLIGFLYWYLKIDFNYTIATIDRRKVFAKSMLVLKGLPPKLDTIPTTPTRYVILSTSEYVFLHNDSDNSTTAIPSVNVFSNTTNITDTAKHPSKLSRGNCFCLFN